MRRAYSCEELAGYCDRGIPLAGAPLDFGKGRWLDLNRGIVSATPAVHNALLKAIQEVDSQPQ